jgi:2-polyprenyl-6-methoxyphenol hydroxylase-like FAD-dependent oxidoreductase
LTDRYQVGGSLAGLFSSIVLLRQGHNVTILERSPTPLLHNQGAGVVAGGETQVFFSVHDRTRRPIAVTSAQRLYLNKQGAIVDREDTVQRMTSWDLLYYLGRANFDRVKSDYLPKGEAPGGDSSEGTARYEYGRIVTDAKEVGEKVEVVFENVRPDHGGADARGDNNDNANKRQTIQADLLIAADGPSSSLRRLLLPSAPRRTHAGYVAFRGTVPECELSAAAEQVFVEKFTFFHAQATQILAYTIPGAAGTLEKGRRLINWVWYCNYEESSSEYEELMTDADGVMHHLTLPTGGKMRPEVWERQKEHAQKTLPPQFAEIVNKTRMPFVQAITDLPPPERGMTFSRLLNGKAMLVGDAVSGFRPHTAASTSQAAFHALQLEGVFLGKLSWDEYEARVLDFARGWYKRGVMLGTRSQFGHHPLQFND